MLELLDAVVMVSAKPTKSALPLPPVLLIVVSAVLLEPIPPPPQPALCAPPEIPTTHMALPLAPNALPTLSMLVEIPHVLPVPPTPTVLLEQVFAPIAPLVPLDPLAKPRVRPVVLDLSPIVVPQLA